MQPRISLLALVFFIIWAISSFRQPIALLMIVLTSMVVAIGPSMMIGRNFIANDFFAVSTNLGTTMNIGAGPDSTGGYTNKASGVPCPTIQGNPAAQDSHRVICVLEWYRNNPGEAVGLFVRKLQYHWSPWFGPLANGTTARSPWLDYHPFKSMIETQDGINFVYGNSGKLVSWAWLSGSMGFMIYGFIVLWRAKGLAQVFGMLLLAPSVFNALSSMLTIGDNRFRIPTMTLSVLLQLVGIYSIFAKRNLRMWTNRRVEPTWPGLKWKQNSEKDSLPNVDSGKA
jgi:hypothetical protein